MARLVLLVSALCCVSLASARTTEQFRAIDEPLPQDSPFDDVNTDAETYKDESRFLTSSGTTGTATATALNNFIDRQQQLLENLRPTSTSSTSSTSGSNVYYANSGTTTTGSSGLTSAQLQQIISNSLRTQGSGQRRRRRPSGNRRRNSNRSKRRRPQVFVLRP